MKRTAFFLTLLSCVVLFVSCGGKKGGNAPESEEISLRPVEPVTPEYTFTHEDTVAVIDLVNQFIAHLNRHDLGAAVDMLSFLNGDSIEPLTKQARNRQGMSLATCVGVRYEIDHLIFESDKKNEVKMDITLFEKPDNDPRPNKTSFYFRPVRFHGKWYLTTKDNITDTNSQERNEKPASSEPVADNSED